MERDPPSTLEEIEQLTDEILYPWHVAKYLGTCENTINCAARARLLPWAYKLGKHTRIPKQAFVNWHKYGAAFVK